MLTETESYELYLFDDDKNTEVFVVEVLMEILSIPIELATKIMLEVQKKGKALLDIDDKCEAIKKRDLLISLGLNSQICQLPHV